MTERRNNEGKTISSLFREHEHKLHEAPSGRAWRQLEAKLDQRRNRHRVQLRRQYALAASLALLIGLIGLISWLAESSDRQVVAAAQAPQVQLEDIPLQVEQAEPIAQQVAELSRQYQAAPRIEEGQSAQRIVPRPNPGPAPRSTR
jgi:hypothetical protein